MFQCLQPLRRWRRRSRRFGLPESANGVLSVLSIAFQYRSGDRLRPLLLVLLLVLGANRFRLTGQMTAANGNVKLLWETVIQETAFEVECKASALSNKDGSVWLVLGRRPALAMTGP